MSEAVEPGLSSFRQPPGTVRHNCMATFYQYQTIELIKDLNPVITKGLAGVILEIWDDNAYEVEFVKEDGTNYEYEGQFTFTLSPTDIKPISS